MAMESLTTKTRKNLTTSLTTAMARQYSTVMEKQNLKTREAEEAAAKRTSLLMIRTERIAR
jgi:hypothetical protein